MGIGMLTVAAKPSPAAVGQLHGGQAFDAGADHGCDFIFVKYRVVAITAPLPGALLIGADFLGIEVGVFVADGFQINPHAS